MVAHTTGNQSGAEKDNRLFFGEQWMLLFSKSKMAATSFSQLGAKLRIQDGGAYESRPCWKTAHQPRWRTGIGLTDFHDNTNHTRVTQKKCHATSKLILTVSCGPKWQRSVRQVARLRDLGPTLAYTGCGKASWTMTSSVTNQSELKYLQWLASPVPLS